MKSGNSKIVGSGRIELEAINSSGTVFPAELSIGFATGTDQPVFIGYLRDISQRLETEKELTQARDMALAAAKTKSDFLATMSHEMRTPLNGVIGLLELLSEENLTPVQRRFVETARRSGEILETHINDVLDLEDRIKRAGIENRAL